MTLLSGGVLAAAAPANTVPDWFWTWATWSLDGHRGTRPAAAPQRIPPWAWRLLRAHEHRAKAVAAAPAPAGLGSSEQALLAAMNAARAANGLGALSIDTQLEHAARDHTADLLANGAFTHDYIKGGTSYPFSTWIRWYDSGVCAGENLAYATGGLSAATAVRLWLGSPPHRANLLSPSYHTVGVALSGSGGSYIATTDFGGC